MEQEINIGDAVETVQDVSANAHLISAAPDLLAALEQCREFISVYIKAGQSGASVEGLPAPYEVEGVIKRAISKARKL